MTWINNYTTHSEARTAFYRCDSKVRLIEHPDGSAQIVFTDEKTESKQERNNEP